MNINSKNWQAIGPWGAGTISSIAIDPNNSQIVYVSVWGRGVYKSIDAGASWYSSSTGLISLLDNPAGDPLRVLSLAIHPVDSNIIYAGTRLAGVYKSVNSGQTWELATSTDLHYVMCSFQNIIFDKNNPKTMYAACTIPQGGYIFKSDDFGVNWVTQKRQNGVDLGPNEPQFWSFQAIGISTLDSGVVYAGASKSSNSFVTNDGGVDWLTIGLVNKDVAVIKCDLLNSNSAYAGTLDAGVFKTSDSGKNWTSINQGLESQFIINMAINPLSPQNIYCATVDGVYSSNDSGSNWKRAGLDHTVVVSLECDPNNQDTLYAGGYRYGSLILGGSYRDIRPEEDKKSGLYKSTDSGTSWKDIGKPYLPALNMVKDLVIDPVDPNTIYIISDQGLIKTTNAGVSWTKLIIQDTNEIDSSMRRLVIDPSNTQNLFLATVNYGFFASKDEGESWTNHTKGLNFGGDMVAILALNLAPKNNQKIYMGTSYRGIVKSKDGGINWSPINNFPYKGPGPILEILIDPSDPQLFYSRDISNLYISRDEGVNWTILSIDHDVSSFSVAQADFSTIYAGILGGVLKSEDYGKTWIKLNNGLPSSLCIDLLIHPENPSILFASFGFLGVYMSIDTGLNWQSFNDSLLTTSATSLTVHPAQKNTLYVGSSSSGVFKKVFDI